MKATTIISAFVFAHAAFAQATDSSSVASASVTATNAGSSSAAAASTASEPVSVSASASQPTSKTSTRTGTKSASQSEAQSSSVAGTPTPEPSPTGSAVPIADTQTSSSGNPLIPSSISESCGTFLNKLNTDTALASCFTPLTNALSSFNPTTGTGSLSAVSKTLNNLCAVTACSASTIRAKLTEYKDNCSEELTGANPDKTVINNYDVLYSLIPYKNAICAKDVDTQAYCLLNIGTGSSASNTTANVAATSDSVTYASSHLSNAIVAGSRRRAQSVLVPNADTYRNSHLIYLFTSPDMNAGQLCTSCTQQIISKYVAFESSTPYALGLKNSPLLGGQSELWSALQEKCPSTFLSEVSNIAGVETAEDINGAAAVAGSMFTALAGAFLAAVALF